MIVFGSPTDDTVTLPAFFHQQLTVSLAIPASLLPFTRRGTGMSEGPPISERDNGWMASNLEGLN